MKRVGGLLQLLLCIGLLRETHGRSIKRIVHFSDVHLNLSASLDQISSSQIPTRYGFDSPVRLLESALAYASQVVPHPEILLYTGDHVAHGRGHSNEYIQKVVQQNVEMMDTYFPSTTTLRVTAIAGNSDSNPGYYMHVNDDATAILQANPTLEMIASSWSHSLSSSQLEAFTTHGYLTYELDSKLTIITLNTVPYSPKHLPASSAVDDPLGQFAWLTKTLQKLRADHKFAYIAGHLPPIIDSNRTVPMWQEHYIRTYRSIVSSYADVVKAQFFGHVHSIEFRLPVESLSSSSSSQPESEQPLMIAADESPLFLSGSISPLFGNNPSFTVWEFDDQTYDLLDYVVYSTANFSSAMVNQDDLGWKPLFRASDMYNIPSLATSSLRQLRARMRSDKPLLAAYYWNMKAQSHNLPPCTTDECRARIQCTLTWWPTHNDYAACVDALQPRSLGSQLPVSHLVLGIMASLCAYTLVCVAGFAFKRLRRAGRVMHVARDSLKKHELVNPMDAVASEKQQLDST